MEQKVSVLDVVCTIVEFVLAFLCALLAVRDLAREGTQRLRSGVIWIVTSGAWLACGLLSLMGQGRLSVEIIPECDAEEEGEADGQE